MRLSGKSAEKIVGEIVAQESKMFESELDAALNEAMVYGSSKIHFTFERGKFKAKCILSNPKKWWQFWR